jgi:hypothetical protein
MHELYSARKHPEFVVLELGDQIGALIVHADASLRGIEIEISPTGEDANRTHMEVLERSIAGRPAFTAVFDGLAAGFYTLWSDGEAHVRGVAVTAGQVAELDWRTAG